MSKLTEILGKDAEYYLGHVCKTIDKSMIHVPSKDTVDRLWIDSDRNNRVLCNMQRLLGHGRLGGTGYVSILPVDQGIEHSGGASNGSSDLHDAVVTAVVNKRAGGMGLISGRKAFQKPMKDGVELLNTIQDVYLDKDVTIA